jgi:hypothetical protein
MNYKIIESRLIDLQIKLNHQSANAEISKVQKARRSISLNTYRKMSKRSVVKDLKTAIEQTKATREKKKKLLKYLESEMEIFKQQKSFVRKVMLEFFR